MTTATLRHLAWQVDDDGEGRSMLEAMASHRSDDAATGRAIETELQQVLAWAHRHFGHDQGPLDDGHAWHHELQRRPEADGWHTVTLTLAATPAFYDAFVARFGEPAGDDD